MNIQSNIPLAPLTSWLVGGPAEFFCRPQTLDDLQSAQTWAQDRGFKISILGEASNVLIADAGIRGLVICMRDLSGFETRLEGPPENQIFKIEALAGTGKSELLRLFIKQKLAPALFLAGLPGNLGGGIVMNAGVGENFKPREFHEIVEWIEVLRPGGHVEKLMHSQLQWSYRHLSGWQPGIVVRAGLAWPNQPDPGILDKVREANRVRLNRQPLDKPSCGSVFVNPPGQKAAALIDSCGLKGYTCGEAQVSLKHANFIVNLGACRASDILAVIQHVQTVVLKTQGIMLQTEVIRLGEF